jgi:hypothetical protein
LVLPLEILPLAQILEGLQVTGEELGRIAMEQLEAGEHTKVNPALIEHLLANQTPKVRF